MSDFFQKYITGFESCLKRTVSQKPVPSLQLKAAIEYSLLNGGKRFRPLLVYLTGELLQTERAPLDVIASSVEMMHCYSLIHDDLPAMDNDDFRRGRPSCHRAFDQATAILAGDALSSWSIELLVSELPAFTSASNTLSICKRLLEAIGVEGMISGQSLDLTVLVSNKAVNENDLERIHQLKTGYLIQACILMVSDLVVIEKEKLEALQQFSNYLGLAFQMQDDYLDRYAPGSALGKMRSSDLENNKTTYAQIYDEHSLKKKINLLFSHCHEALFPLIQGGSPLNDLVVWLQSRIVL